MSIDRPAPETVPVSRTDDAADLLARAFRNDPLGEYLIGDSEFSLDRARPFFAANIRMGRRSGKVEYLPDMEAVAVWLSPGKTKIGFWKVISSGLLSATSRLGRGAVRRFLAFDRIAGPLESRIVEGPHWLLLLIGVDPERQGRGLGGRLLRPTLDEADLSGVPCYLDSTNPRNLAFYLRHGFEVAEKTKVPDGPDVWAMLRKPHSTT